MIHIILQGSQQNPTHGASHSMVVQAALSGKWELTTCNAFSRLTRDPSTTFQSSTGAHTKRTAATRYHMLCCGHCGHCSLRLPYLLCILPTIPIVLLTLFTAPIVSLFTLSALFTEPRVSKMRAKRLEKDSMVYSLLAGMAAITQLLFWLRQRPEQQP